jgi:hypothetical protein
MRLAQTALLLVAMFALPAAAQSTWYVDVHATPPGNGSAASPYTSIQYAIVQPTTHSGDALLVAPGTYVENIHIGASGPFVHIVSAGGPTVTELRSFNPAKAGAYLYSGTLEGFTVTGNGSGGINGGALNLGSGSAVRCVLRDNFGLGVYSYSGSLDQCTILGGIVVECFGAIQMSNTIVTGAISPGCLGNGINYCAGPDPDLNSGTGNVIGNPGLWNFPGAEHLLAPGSPCIDAADPALLPDPDGSPADIGAIPFDADFNPNPTIFCTAKPTSLGCVPQIGFQGHATYHGEAPFVVSATQVHPNSPGLLFYGPGAHFLPFQGAWHCVEFPTPRVGGQFAGGSGLCGGTYSFDFAAHLAAGAHEFVTPGAQLACQWWSRDTEDPTGFGTTLTDALLFSVVP